MSRPRPFQRLRYLYVGSDRFDTDLAYYRDTLGGRIVWHFRAFDTDVCAFDLGDGPLVLLAEHRPAGSVVPVWLVDDLEATVTALRAHGWDPTEGPFGIPDGDCYLFTDPSGNEHAVFGNERPDALAARYAEPDAEGAVYHDGRPGAGGRGVPASEGSQASAGGVQPSVAGAQPSGGAQ